MSEPAEDIVQSGDNLESTTITADGKEQANSETSTDDKPTIAAVVEQSTLEKNCATHSELIPSQNLLDGSKESSNTEKISNVSGEISHTKLLEQRKKPEDDKLGIYKAFAIKLKKELVKSRDELQRLQSEYKQVVVELEEKVKTLDHTLQSERVSNANTNTTLEATVRNLKQQLETAESDLKSLQNEFENYKVRATKIIQDNNISVATLNKALEEDRYKQLKSLCDEQKRQLNDLTSQLSVMSDKNKDLEQHVQVLTEELAASKVQIEELKKIEDSHRVLERETESLVQIVRQYELKYGALEVQDTAAKDMITDKSNETGDGHEHNTAELEADPNSINRERRAKSQDSDSPASPGALVKDDDQTNSSSSFDSSTYGYVHIKPTAFEIISRSSALENAQKQIDNLTKAYLDSESTNSLLNEQINALKGEIRRIQRGNDRMELANNLEYLKNVMFKFLSLDSNHLEQKQRLIPVIGTILKLSPEETAQLSSLTVSERSGMTSSFFKL